MSLHRPHPSAPTFAGEAGASAGRETIREFHMRRARVELDLAYRAEKHQAMEAHLRLSALHMARLRDVAQLQQAHALARGPSAAKV